MTAGPRAFGDVLRELRETHRISQLDLALRADVSQRHLSFVETGRSRPTAELIGRLADALGLTAREHNRLRLAAGHAPVPARLAEPELAQVRATVLRVLRAHEPAPAMLLDRHWTMLEANAGVALLADLVAPFLLKPPVNVVRATLHPEGLAPHVGNLGEWRAHLLARLRRQIETSPDPELLRLHAEAAAFPVPEPADVPVDEHAVYVPLRLRHPSGVLSFLSTMTVFGNALDVTVAELSVETFFPADAHTASVLRR
ncbi:helix-turn-helix transcriptional regulator [Actinocorallia sp. A-T 12471]|uniref:helix-turn-helix domain-containing protein n=1 Tax=Actinocorallia sp. A-T 12471 TaxID=3089813 RepID=UPI0029CF476E|nr:helix-turn-helix transcriptional regulator [Actinocorallia sp. A-T 12471]MDX6742665.1 helix-turn-helix transcriptional regulator [Actinocorallia sp. A-T 12471]